MKRSVIIIGAGISGLCMAALLVKRGFSVSVYEKSNFVGGRTHSMVYKNHILDNGFHIMPFYKTSSVYKLLQEIGIVNSLQLAKVSDVAFYEKGQYYDYPRDLISILKFSMLSFSRRLLLLKLFISMAFSSIEKSEKLDNVPLTRITDSLDSNTKAFFEAICTLAFADSPPNVALGEFIRMIIRANPLKGGTSEMAYPQAGGYDTICKLISDYVKQNGGLINLGQTVKEVKIENGRATAIKIENGDYIQADCIVVTHPAYNAIRELFDINQIPEEMQLLAKKIEKTTSVIEAHFCVSEKIEKRQIVFPVGDFITKAIFFNTNITQSVSPKGEFLIMAGAPVPSASTEDPVQIKQITQKMKDEIAKMYPNFTKSLVWERAMAWKLVEAVVKEPGMVWKQKFPHSIGITGLFFIGDSTVGYGIGTDSAAHSSLLCFPKIIDYLENTTNTTKH